MIYLIPPSPIKSPLYNIDRDSITERRDWEGGKPNLMFRDETPHHISVIYFIDIYPTQANPNPPAYQHTNTRAA